MNDSDALPRGNFGLFPRAKMSEDSAFIDLEGPIHMDICQQDRFLINGVQVAIKLWPNRDTFCLMSSESGMKYEIQIDDVILRCCYLKINPEVLLGHSEGLQKQLALYPFKKSDIKCFGIPAGQFHLNVDDVFQGEILMVGLVSSKACSGHYTLNPYNFEHFNCNFAAFYVDGKSVPSAPVEPNFTTGNYVTAFLSMVGGR